MRDSDFVMTRIGFTRHRFCAAEDKRGAQPGEAADERIQWVQILEVDTQLVSVLILSAQPADGAKSVYYFRLMVMNTRKAPNNIVADR